MSKKQNSVSLSTVEAEYIAVGSCCSQLLWMKKLLTNYGISQDTMVVYCDNSSAIEVIQEQIMQLCSFLINLRFYKIIFVYFTNRYVPMHSIV